MMARLLLVTSLLLFAGAVTGDAADIVILNMDGAGEGFNDPTPVAPAPGNPGTTRGQQRMNVCQAAADMWGSLLPGTVTIYVEAQFDPLFCNSSDAFLAFSGALEAFKDFPGADQAGTWYHVALANQMAGVDLSMGNDITIYVNSDIDNNNNCLQGSNWYYGLDGNEGLWDVELLPVVLHELAHALGFSSFVDMTTGAEFMGSPDIYETFVLDGSTGMHWDDMSNAQRQTSVENSPYVVWDGPVVTALADSMLRKASILVSNSPPALPDTIPLETGPAGSGLTTTGITADVVLVDDGTGTTSDACEPIINGVEVAGNIALIDRGECIHDHTEKAERAAAVGAVAVIIPNNIEGYPPFYLSGLDPNVAIPVVSIGQADGDSIKAHLAEGVNVTLKLDPNNLLGADGSGRVQLYAPASRVSQNSISHWSRDATPDLLMEPSLNRSLSSDVDLTLPLFEDLGWLDVPTGIGDSPPWSPSVAGLELLPSYPNPFNPRTTIRYTVPGAQAVDLAIYDVRGGFVRSLARRVDPAGTHEVTWDGLDDDGRPAGSGVYFVRLAGEGRVATRKIVLLK